MGDLWLPIVVFVVAFLTRETWWTLLVRRPILWLRSRGDRD